MISNPFITKNFPARETLEEGSSVAEEIDKWLNSLVAPGLGISVVGYAVGTGGALVTVKRWSLTDGRMRMTQSGPGERFVPTVIDEEFDTPSVQIGDAEEKSTAV